MLSNHSESETAHPDSLILLVQSEIRARILEEIRDEGCSLADLRTALSSSRPTIQRNLRKLQERGWVVESASDRNYRITPAGEAAIERFKSVCSDFRALDSVSTFFKHMPDIDLPPIEELTSSKIVTRNAPAMHRPALFVRQELEDASTLRGFMPVVNPIYIETVLQMENEGELELITSPDGVQTLRSKYSDDSPFLLDSSTDAIKVVEEPPDYLLYRLDDKTLVAAYNDEFHLQAVLCSSSDEIRTWAANRYDRVASEVL